jgi:hypothetical protein
MDKVKVPMQIINQLNMLNFNGSCSEGRDLEGCISPVFVGDKIEIKKFEARRVDVFIAKECCKLLPVHFCLAPNGGIEAIGPTRPLLLASLAVCLSAFRIFVAKVNAVLVLFFLSCLFSFHRCVLPVLLVIGKHLNPISGIIFSCPVTLNFFSSFRSYHGQRL